MAYLSLNEIKNRAAKFSNDWENITKENAESQTFLNEFLNIFGVNRRQVASFEQKAKRIQGGAGRIDMFWPTMLLVEMKSRGKDMSEATNQAFDYLDSIKPHELPKYVMICDFHHFILHNLDTKEIIQFTLPDLVNQIENLKYLGGYEDKTYREQDPINQKAAEQMGRLHDLLAADGYSGHQLEVYLVRLMFCMFAEDSGIFEKQQFENFIRERTSEDGTDLAGKLQTLFQTLNKPMAERMRSLDDSLKDFPYVNGGLFKEALETAAFDSKMRQTLLHAAAMDWSGISPAIFGSMFQSIMNKGERRNLGAHYTSEKNILKLIEPLFLDDLRLELSKIDSLKNQSERKRRLMEFHDKLANIKIFDPACGCGNFLIIAYRELRQLELNVLKALYGDQADQRLLLVEDLDSKIKVNIHQMHGIEIEEFPAEIAKAALYLVDHQMNRKVSAAFGVFYVHLPLPTAANIVHGNALRCNWQDILPSAECTYIIGNPPFIGRPFQSYEQKQDKERVLKVGIPNYGNLDYVACWHVKAAEYICGSNVEVALVSTNSICQGEQVELLWPFLMGQKHIKINFAHQSFKWSNEATGNAQVMCIIIGFALWERSEKTIYSYADVRGEPTTRLVKNINPYLIDAPDIWVKKQSKPLCDIPKMSLGNQPTDNGNFLFTEEEKDEFLKQEPNAKKYIKKFLGAREFINNIPRYCLWLTDISPSELRSMPHVMKRIEAVKEFRLSSKKVATRVSAQTSWLFQDIRDINNQPYLFIPLTSSERREYLPIGYINANVITSNLAYMLPNATLYEFGIMTSNMHMAWMRITAGRLKTDYRYSNTFVYNTFPWPNPTKAQKDKIMACAQAVLDARAEYPDETYADLYDATLMPPNLRKAHKNLDKAVEDAYRKAPFADDNARIVYLFNEYAKLTADMLTQKPKRRKKTK